MACGNLTRAKRLGGPHLVETNATVFMIVELAVVDRSPHVWDEESVPSL